MYDMKVANGDLVLEAGGSAATVSGHERIKQDLACWLLEPLGTDPAYGRFGSKIHDFVGTPMWDTTVSDIRTEIARIVNNYAAYQNNEYQKAVASGGRANVLYTWSLSDLLTGSFSMHTRVQDDKIRITVALQTQGGDTITIDEVI